MRHILTIFGVTTFLLLSSIKSLAAIPSTYGPTTASDHLWYIAQKVRPSQEVSKQQTMMALLKANPQAFSANNVNGLLAGYRLKVPSLAQIKAIPALNAYVEISAQNVAWLHQINFNPLKQPKASGELMSMLGLHSPEEFPQWLIHPLESPLKTTLSMSVSPKLASNAGPFLTAAAAEKLIEKDIALHLAQMSQRAEDFLRKINQIDQSAHQKIEAIADEQSRMKNQISNLDKQVQQLRDNYLHLSSSALQQSSFNEYGLWILGSSVLLCLIVLIVISGRRRNVSIHVKDNPSVSLKDTIEAVEDEYDFLGSQEGVAAKLDLARAYIDMGNSDEASQVLNEVIAQGNDEQRTAARKILSEITRETVH